MLELTAPYLVSCALLFGCIALMARVFVRGGRDTLRRWFPVPLGFLMGGVLFLGLFLGTGDYWWGSVSFFIEPPVHWAAWQLGVMFNRTSEFGLYFMLPVALLYCPLLGALVGFAATLVLALFRSLRLVVRRHASHDVT